MRDFQRQKVYDAEDTAFPEFREEVELTPKELEEYFYSLYNSKFVTNLRKLKHVLEPHPDFKLNFGDERHKLATANSGEATFPFTTRNKYFVIHELAHVLTYDGDGSKSVSPHGREYCDIYLKLVLQFLGDEHHTELLTQFIVHNVKFSLDK